MYYIEKIIIIDLFLRIFFEVIGIVNIYNGIHPGFSIMYLNEDQQKRLSVSFEYK